MSASSTTERDPGPDAEACAWLGAEVCRGIIGNLNDVLYAVDRDLVITYVNSAAKLVLGYSPEELVGKSLAILIHSEDLPEIKQGFRDVLSNRLYPSDYRVLTKAGDIRWVRTSSRPVFDGETILGLCGIMIDITERKAMEADLLASESRLRAVTDSANDAILMMDPEGQVSYWNPAAERILGYGSNEAIGRDLHRLIAPERYRDGFRAAFPRFQQQGQGTAVGKTIELTARRKDGTEIPVALSLSTVQIRGGWHAVGIIRDISEAKNAEAKLRAGQETLRLVLDNAHDAFISVDSDGVITNWNAKAEHLFGWTVAEVIGCPLEVIMPPRFRTDDAVDCQWELATTPNANVSSQFETTTVTRAGREFPVEATLWSISVKDMWQLNIFLRDLSDAKAADGELMQLELQLRQAQKLEAIGALAAGISHEINTPTQYVGDNIRFMASAFADMDKALSAAERALLAARANTLTSQLVDEVESEFARADVAYLRGEVPLALTQAEEGVQRVSAIVRAMKEFAHPGPLQKAPADLNQAIESTVTVCRNEWKYVAELILDLDPALPPVPCQIGEVKQVILNLIVNAAHAIGEVGPGDSGKGRITIATVKDGRHAVIRVRDTGAGIPEAVRDRIFDPFFTTKPVGKGSGQGLAIAHNVVTVKHHGSIAFESSFGHGTEFVIRLPLDVAPDAVTGDEHEEANTVRG